jgi:hypothetical protein
MPQATPADVRLIGSYLATGSAKRGAHALGMSEAAYRGRLHRLFRRFGVHNMAALLSAIDPDVNRTAGWYADDVAPNLGA